MGFLVQSFGAHEGLGIELFPFKAVTIGRQVSDGKSSKSNVTQKLEKTGVETLECVHNEMLFNWIWWFRERERERDLKVDIIRWFAF
jgi:hypothetical protein